MRHTARLSLVVLVAALGGCGWVEDWHGWGSGTGGGGGGGTTNPPAAPTIAITAPADGTSVYGSRTIAVTGTVSGTGIQSVTVALNGGTAAAATVSGTTFTAEVTLADRANTVVASVTASGGSASATAQVTYPFVSLVTFQTAETVIGQADASHGNPNQGAIVAAANTIATPVGAAAFDGTHLFVPDSGNNRVLAFTGIPAADGAQASYAIGQGAFDQVAPSVGARGLNTPQTIRTAGTKLLVLDYMNYRVVIYDPIPGGFDSGGLGAAAVIAVGAKSLDDQGTASCSSDGLAPESMFVVGDKLIVGDSANNRVLIWNSIPVAFLTPPDLVLGQDNSDGMFDTCGMNAGGISAASMNYPTDIWSDGTRLFVADAGNNRILGWSTFPTASHAPADLVLGQTDFGQGGPGLSSGTLNYPYSLTSNGNQLFVADWQNNRVLVWNTLPTACGPPPLPPCPPPNVVLGQGSFDLGAANDDNQDGTQDTVPSGRTLNIPAGVLLLDDALVVTDGGNSRFLVFGAQ